jgi:hypothetical protein
MQMVLQRSRADVEVGPESAGRRRIRTHHSEQERGRQDDAGRLDGVRGGSRRSKVVMYQNYYNGARPQSDDIPPGCWAKRVYRDISGLEKWVILIHG